MLLGIRFLNDVANVNSYEYMPGSPEFFAGDNQTVYFQVIDASLDRSDQGFMPAGRRYMPLAGATVTVTLVNIDDAKQFDRSASQPFAQDTSIWSIPILPTDPIDGTVRLSFVLAETGRILHCVSQPGAFLAVR